jgi:hypothetical protein
VETRTLTDEQKRARAARSRALAWALGAFAVLLWVVTYFKLGANILNRPL